MICETCKQAEGITPSVPWGKTECKKCKILFYNMKKIKCQKCKYDWITKSTHIYVSCPSCLSKVLNNRDVKP